MTENTKVAAGMVDGVALALRALEVAGKDLERFGERVADGKPVALAAGKAITGVPFAGGLRITMSAVTGCVELDCDPKRVSDVMPLRTALSRGGFMQIGKARVEPECRQVSYHYSLAVDAPEGVVVRSLELIASFWGSDDIAEGAGCRFVKVGVKEEPVYGLECDGAPVDLETQEGEE